MPGVEEGHLLPLLLQLLLLALSLLLLLPLLSLFLARANLGVRASS